MVGDPLPGVDADALAWIDTEQMIEVDRVMIEDLHIELIQMMENAGRNLARLVHRLFAPASVAIAKRAALEAGDEVELLEP